jgi:predicted RNA-binding protein YlxR (DUF448 family)
MRTLLNDPARDPDIGTAGVARRRGAHQPERRCILTGEVGPACGLLRLAIGPDGALLPDVLGKAPGRGAWLGVDRAALEAAIAKGKLKNALARAFKGAALTVPADLPDRIDAAFRRFTLDRLGLEARGGHLLTGTDRIAEAARGGAVALLLHASDAAADGRRKLAQAWRVGMDREGSGDEGLVLPLDRTALSMALGRENAVHLALVDRRAAARVMALLGRWQFYLGWARDAADTDPALKPDAGDTAPDAM